MPRSSGRVRVAELAAEFAVTLAGVLLFVGKSKLLGLSRPTAVLDYAWLGLSLGGPTAACICLLLAHRWEGRNRPWRRALAAVAIAELSIAAALS